MLFSLHLSFLSLKTEIIGDVLIADLELNKLATPGCELVAFEYSDTHRH